MCDKVQVAGHAPLSLAGAHFFLAFLLLWPFVVRKRGFCLSPHWRYLALMGFIQYTVGARGTFHGT
mgnify:CR=1 FL=1